MSSLRPPVPSMVIEQKSSSPPVSSCAKNTNRLRDRAKNRTFGAQSGSLSGGRQHAPRRWACRRTAPSSRALQHPEHRKKQHEKQRRVGAGRKKVKKGFLFRAVGRERGDDLGAIGAERGVGDGAPLLARRRGLHFAGGAGTAGSRRAGSGSGGGARVLSPTRRGVRRERAERLVGPGWLGFTRAADEAIGEESGNLGGDFLRRIWGEEGRRFGGVEVCALRYCALY
jgi:hypothetical protein